VTEGDGGGVEVISAAAAPAVPTMLRRIVWRRNLAEYASDFGCSPQTLKHWIRIGKRKGKLPPLDERWSLAGWWLQCMTIRVPDKLLEFEKERPAQPGVPTAPGAAAPGAGAPPPPSLGMNLDEMQGKVGDGLLQARRLLEANYNALQLAYRDGTEAQIEQRERRWQKSLEAVRRAEKEERAAREQGGELIDRADLVADLLMFMEVLRTMRASMPARVLKRLADLDPDTARRVGAAIEAERMAEDAPLRQLSVLKSVADVELQLVAA
jgi:hypothetical protein